MNINKEQIDDLNLLVSVEVNKDDYTPKVSDVLRDYRRKASMQGFRPGKVPEGLIRKMYGKAVLVDEINKLVSESLQKYIEDEKLKVLGDPIPTVDGEDMEWEIGNDFKFNFEMGIAPDIECTLSKDDQLTKYEILVAEDLIDQNIENYVSRYGKFVEIDTISDFKEKLTGNILQLNEEGQPLEDGLSAEDSSILLSLIKDEQYRKPFENAQVDGEIVFNLSQTFPNDWEVASILRKKDKSEVGDIQTSLFRYTIRKIEKYVNAEIDQELFDKVFGEGTVASVEEFRQRIKDDIAAEFEDASMVKFGSDARKYLLEKINPALPEAFLRKWLWNINKDKVNEADFDNDFPRFLEGTQWEMISDAIFRKNDIKIVEQDILDVAKDVAKKQFMQYGIPNFSDDILTNYANGLLKEKKASRQFATQAIANKVVKTIYDSVDVIVQQLSLDDFNAMMSPVAEPEVENNEENQEPENQEIENQKPESQEIENQESENIEA